MWDKLALILLIIGGVNWGLVGVFEFDLVAWIFGGSACMARHISTISRKICKQIACKAVTRALCRVSMCFPHSTVENIKVCPDKGRLFCAVLSMHIFPQTIA